MGDQSLADYNLGNEEEEQLLADDYDNAVPQNVPYREIDMVLPENSYNRGIEYSNTVSEFCQWVILGAEFYNIEVKFILFQAINNILTKLNAIDPC